MAVPMVSSAVSRVSVRLSTFHNHLSLVTIPHFILFTLFLMVYFSGFAIYFCLLLL